MKSYVKLSGPSLDKGIDALNVLVKEFQKRYPYGKMVTHIISIIDPSIDLQTRESIEAGRGILGEYDFVFEWKETPQFEQVRSLIRSIDEALLYTGCKYTITTK